MEVWLLVFILVAVLPVVGYLRFRRMMRLPHIPATSKKLQLYGLTVSTQWALVLFCAWIQTRHGSTLGALGLDSAGDFAPWLVAIVLMAALIASTHLSVHALLQSPPEETPDRIVRLTRILPVTWIERAGFLLVAVTAGFCEEVLYRGFLIQTLEGVLGNTPMAVVLAGVAFGVGHFYQGRTGIATTGALGIALGAIYVWSGTLWPGIVLHFAIYLANGFTLGSASTHLVRLPGPRPAESDPPSAV